MDNSSDSFGEKAIRARTMLSRFKFGLERVVTGYGQAFHPNFDRMQIRIRELTRRMKREKSVGVKMVVSRKFNIL